MEIEDEINQINSIINKLDVIRDDEWQKKDDETEEEFDNRLEAIEEELEEELLDYISDSLLTEQKINLNNLKLIMHRSTSQKSMLNFRKRNNLSSILFLT